MASYKILVGIEYEGKRAEAGAIVNDLPSKSVSWLLAQNIIEPTDNATADAVTPQTTAAREPKSPGKGGK